MLSRVSNARGIWMRPGWSTSPCFPRQEFRTARNIVGRACRRRNTDGLLKGFTIYSGVDFRSGADTRPYRLARLVPASYVRIETTNPTTSDAPSGADLLGHRPEENSNGVQFPEEKEFRLLGFTELRRSFLFASLWIFNGWKFAVVRTGLFDN